MNETVFFNIFNILFVNNMLQHKLKTYPQISLNLLYVVF